MGCRYQDECPSFTGWCKVMAPKQDFSKCVSFLITAYENEKKKRELLQEALDEALKDRGIK